MTEVKRGGWVRHLTDEQLDALDEQYDDGSPGHRVVKAEIHRRIRERTEVKHDR